MINRRTLIPTIFAVALVALSLPALAAAQGGYYGHDRDDDSYRRDDNRRYGNYDQRRLRESVKRLENLSDDFRKRLDRSLDRSRYDDSRREDNINNVAREFQNAADTLEDRFDSGRNLNRSSNEARRVLQLGMQLDRVMGRNRFDNRVESEWTRIRQELRYVADAYGFNMLDFKDSYYRRDDDNNRRRGNNRRNW
ncbi:MAG: hypothetical protein H7Y30_01560 [Pyrinomonadaceae bacterium]|nr:hypothetical protein [Pyrinomonadaceae bacterium]